MSLTREEAIVAMVQDGVKVQANLNKGTSGGLWAYVNGSFYKENKPNNVGNMAAIDYEIYTPPPKMVTKWLWSFKDILGEHIAGRIFAATAEDIAIHYDQMFSNDFTKLEWSATEFPV